MKFNLDLQKQIETFTFLTDFSAKGRLQVTEVLQTRLKAAVYSPQSVRI